MIESYANAWDSKIYSLLETTLNTRDLGGYRIDGTEYFTQYGRIIRSDVANYPSEKDIEFLKNSSTTTIIDTILHLALISIFSISGNSSCLKFALNRYNSTI